VAVGAGGGGGGAFTELVDCAYAPVVTQTQRAAPERYFIGMVIDPRCWTMNGVTSAARNEFPREALH